MNRRDLLKTAVAATLPAIVTTEATQAAVVRQPTPFRDLFIPLHARENPINLYRFHPDHTHYSVVTNDPFNITIGRDGSDPTIVALEADGWVMGFDYGADMAARTLLCEVARDHNIRIVDRKRGLTSGFVREILQIMPDCDTILTSERFITDDVRKEFFPRVQFVGIDTFNYFYMNNRIGSHGMGSLLAIRRKQAEIICPTYDLRRGPQNVFTAQRAFVVTSHTAVLEGRFATT